MNLRREARGRPCMIRLPGCDGGGETTTLAHYRLAGLSGMGMKPDDAAAGAWACDSCHSIVDGRTKTGQPQTIIRLAHAEGCMRTITTLRKEGKL